MDRRQVLSGSIAALLAPACATCAAAGGTRTRGCRAAVLVGGQPTIGAPMAVSGLGDQVDKEFENMRIRMSSVFSVLPELYFVAGANAFAESSGRNGSPDGAVFIGTTLVKRYWDNFEFSIWVLLAHEFAHIVQFKRNVPEAWQMEPHADFMAGWSLAKAPARNPYSYYGDPDIMRSEALTMFSHGDLAFNDPDHHGDPELRARMVREGYALGDKEALKIDLAEAFVEGARAAQLSL